jgi:type IV pilus assembly protein PilB
MFKVVQEKIGKILVTQGLITEENLIKSLQEQEKRGFKQTPLGFFLTEMGYVSEENVLKAVGIQFNLPVMELKDIAVDSAVMALVPEAMARRLKAMPLYLVEKELTIAISNPTQIEMMDTLASHTRCKLLPILALEREIFAAIESNYGAGSQAQQPTTQVETEEAPMTPLELRRLETAGKEVPIIRIVDDLLLQAVLEGASDIHIEPREDKLSVRMRVDGILKEYHSFTLKQQPAILSRVKIISKLDISERQKPQDGRIKLRIGGKQVDARVSTLPAYYGEKVVLRLLDQQKVQLGLEELALSPHNLGLLNHMIAQPYGLVLVTGPTGSGKSTTLYAALNTINSEEKNIVTVEDPVEYQIPIINQVQVNVKKDLTFATALRSILRQDPNVVMIGEIRDPETGEIATEAALTGHLVLSTLHTNDAPSAIIRLVEMGIEPFLLAPSLLGILAQRLARKICPDCKESFTPKKGELDRLGIPGAPDTIKFSRGKGCSNCKGSGYKGRVAIHEVLVADEAIRGLISERAPAAAIRDRAVQTGFIDMRLDGIRKIIKGITTLEEVLRVTRGI